MKSPEAHIYRFADVEVDPVRGCVRRSSQELRLRQKTFQVLVYLLEQRERLVTKEELMAALWNGTAVTDDALVQCVKDIRKAIGDDSRDARFIKTFPKAGYRFIAPVELRGNGLAIIERQDITSLKLEFEGDVGARTRSRDGELATGRLLPVGSSVTHRNAIRAGMMLLILVGVSGLTFYLRHKASQAQRQLATVALSPAAGKKAIAVMYFENQSNNAELDWLREGLPDMLIANLSRSQKLTVLSRQQLYLLLERTDHKQTDKLQLDDALEIARKSRADVIALGSFAKLGQKIRIDVQLHDARDGHLLSSETLTADQSDQVLSQVDLLSLKLAADLGAGNAGQTNKNGLADVRTNNLEAYRYYSLAQEKAEALHSLEAIDLLRKAVALDPEFAMAHARIGYVYSVTWNQPEIGKPYLEKAFQLSHRLSDKDRLYISAWYATANLDFQRAIGTFQEIIKEFPLEGEAYLELGNLLRGEERFEEAAEVLKQGLLVDPDSSDVYNVLGSVYESLGKYEEAVTTVQRYAALAPNEPNAHDSLGLTYQGAGRYDLAIREYNQALQLNSQFEIAMVHLGNVYAQLGQYREAIDQYRQYIQAAPSDVERARGYRYITVVYLKKGQSDRAAEAAKRATKYEKPYAWAVLIIAVEQADPAKAEKLKEEFVANGPHTSRGAKFPMRYHSYYDGRIALRSGRAAEAIERFKETLRHAPIYYEIDPLEDCLANAYLELGQLDDAIAEYERILQLNPNYPLVHYHLAQAYERKGQQSQARLEYERFLQIWKDADADVPEVIVVRERLSK
jgi:tetratricopeptide (TPR) repeat protein/DNA-binding winged helix-turn-helix (wHTH) protein